MLFLIQSVPKGIAQWRLTNLNILAYAWKQLSSEKMFSTSPGQFPSMHWTPFSYFEYVAQITMVCALSFFLKVQQWEGICSQYTQTLFSILQFPATSMSVRKGYSNFTSILCNASTLSDSKQPQMITKTPCFVHRWTLDKIFIIQKWNWFICTQQFFKAISWPVFVS